MFGQIRELSELEKVEQEEKRYKKKLEEEGYSFHDCVNCGREFRIYTASRNPEWSNFKHDKKECLTCSAKNNAFKASEAAECHDK